jgi:hypothetical protein
MKNRAIATALEPLAEAKPARLLIVDDKPAPACPVVSASHNW